MTSRSRWQLFLMQFRPGGGQRRFRHRADQQPQRDRPTRRGTLLRGGAAQLRRQLDLSADVDEEPPPITARSANLCFATDDGGCSVQFVVTPDTARARHTLSTPTFLHERFADAFGTLARFALCKEFRRPVRLTKEIPMANTAPHNPPFRAEHIGSLLRPPELLKARTDNEDERISDAELRKIEDEHIRKVVALQEEVGLQSITDGEYRRAVFYTDFASPRAQGRVGLLRIRTDVFRRRQEQQNRRPAAADRRPAAMDRADPCRRVQVHPVAHQGHRQDDASLAHQHLLGRWAQRQHRGLYRSRMCSART